VGVHVSTVSRVLRQDPGRIGEETAARIIVAAKELGFQNNRWAASLRSGKTKTIGVLVPRITDVVLATVFEAIERRAAIAGYQAVVSSTWDDSTSRDEQIRRYIGERVDGLIIGDARIRDPALTQLARDGLPLVLVSRASRGFPSIAGDDRRGGGMVAEHLFDSGCRNLAVIAGPDYARTAVDRVSGFVAGARRRGLEVDRAFQVASTFDVKGGKEAMERILAIGVPDGVFAVNDFASIGAMSALRDHGLMPGRDVAVVGYNDIDLSAQLMVPLTSVRIPLEEMGRRAADAMLELLATGVTRSVRLKPVLVVRESSSFLTKTTATRRPGASAAQ
jgi:LacI family transcriptional regulator